MAEAAPSADSPSALDFFAPEQNLTEEEKKQGLPKHPIAVIFHIAWKLGAALCYLFGGLLASVLSVTNTMIPIIICVVFLAFDFWTTKNVSGRLLVGLRWWNDVKPDGTNEWVFESQENSTLINPYESKLFWIVLLLFPAIWAIFFISCLFQFYFLLNWLFVSGVALVLQGSNVVGYIKCARGTFLVMLLPFLVLCLFRRCGVRCFLAFFCLLTRGTSVTQLQMRASA